jgi:hypothetical protein
MAHWLSVGALALASLSLCACVGPASAPPAAPGRIGDAAFLAGVWRQLQGESRVEEFWTGPAGGLMLGAGRELSGGKLAFFEHMRIEERDATLLYVALPFDEHATEFALESLGPQEVVFANEAHDYPKRIRYRLEADGTLVARVEGDGRAEEWRYTRAQ